MKNQSISLLIILLFSNWLYSTPTNYDVSESIVRYDYLYRMQHNPSTPLKNTVISFTSDMQPTAGYYNRFNDLDGEFVSLQNYLSRNDDELFIILHFADWNYASGTEVTVSGSITLSQKSDLFEATVVLQGENWIVNSFKLISYGFE